MWCSSVVLKKYKQSGSEEIGFTSLPSVSSGAGISSGLGAKRDIIAIVRLTPMFLDQRCRRGVHIPFCHPKADSFNQFIFSKGAIFKEFFH